MPPCAFAELHDWSEPLVARPTRAPARAADRAAASPEAPLPITSTSKRSAPPIPAGESTSPVLIGGISESYTGPGGRSRARAPCTLAAMATIGDVMRRDMVTAAPEDTLGETAEKMVERGVGAAAV